MLWGEFYRYPGLLEQIKSETSLGAKMQNRSWPTSVNHEKTGFFGQDSNAGENRMQQAGKEEQ